ncbi:hypothetical protein, partial [Pseudoduganella ginsengisoli]
MAVTAYQLLGASAAHALETRVAEALARWSAEWCPLPDHAVRCVAASTAAPSAAQFTAARQLDSGPVLWAAVPAGLPRWLEQAIFSLDDSHDADGRHLPSPLGGAVAADALAALLDELALALTGSPSCAATEQALPDGLLRHGSGAVVCTVQLGV